MQQIKEQFRQNLYDLFSKRQDATFNLLDALSSDGHQYKSVVELSQSPNFERKYSSITDAITHGLSDADFKKIQTQVFNHTRATVRRWTKHRAVKCKIHQPTLENLLYFHHKNPVRLIGTILNKLEVMRDFHNLVMVELTHHLYLFSLTK